MTEISGPLTLVTEDAAVVTAVWVQAPALRPHGEGAILPQRARATITTGSEVAFSCAPGPAVLIWQAGGVEDQVPILVDDAPSQTLAEVVGAAQLASGRTADELAALVAQVVSGVAAVTAAASSASWDGDRLTVLGATSPPLKGEKGDRGEKGEPGAAGDGTGDVLWSELTPVLAGKAAVSHQHSMADVTGLGDELGQLWEDLSITWDGLDYFDTRINTVDSRIDTVDSRIDTRKGVIHSGAGNPPSSIPGAVVGDYWLNESDMSLHKITGL